MSLNGNINKRLVQRQFDRAAIIYDEIAGMQREIVDELLASCRTSAQKAIDLGCGTGYGLARLAETSQAELVGIDLAPGMLEVASSVNPHATLVIADAESLPFPADCFDLILSSSALQWCDLNTALEEISRIAAPGGQILISSFLQGTLAGWRQLWGLSKSQRFLSFELFAASVSQQAWANTHIWTKTYTQRFYSFDDAVSSVRDLGAGNAGSQENKGLMGRRRLERVKAAVNEQIRQRGAIELSYEVVFVSAEKVNADG